ncbi:MAG TPA: HIT domain-containing protein [Candidatus Paceibacterota bacterium]
MKRVFIGAVAGILGGIALGAYLFADTQPRAFLQAPDCAENCFSAEQLLGLLGSVGVQKFPGLIPQVIKETDKTVAMKHPVPQADIHYVIVPKKDIKTVGDISPEDADSLVDAYAVLNQIITEQNLTAYKVIINGPKFQTVQYLHFHLVSDLPE